MKQAAFKRTDKKIDTEAAASFVNNSPAELNLDIKTTEKKDIKEENKKEFAKEAKKEFLLRMPSELHKKLKIKAVEKDTNMGDMILEAIEKVYFYND